jgi:hypothetical protein
MPRLYVQGSGGSIRTWLRWREHRSGALREITGKLLNEAEVSGATRRDRTGDLLITKFRVWRDVVDYRIGGIAAISAISA